MAYFQRYKVLALILNGAYSDVLQNYIKFLKLQLLESSPAIGANPRFYHRNNSVGSKFHQNWAEKCSQIYEIAITEAEEALLNYMQFTRSIPYIHAEYMSKNSPIFLRKLLEKVQIGPMDDDIGHSITRYLRYHPINEFEPFFESIGLKPYEFIPILPRLIYLTDNNLLLQNYSVLCNYGFPRDRIGHIYMEATEVFSYHGGILESKLKTFEDMGLNRLCVCMFVISAPSILIDDGSVVKFVKEINILGIEIKFIEAQLMNGKSYNLAQIIGVLCFIFKLCDNRNHVREIFLQRPDFLFEESGNKTFSLIVFLLKCGLTMQGILSLFQQFPNIKVGEFLQNMRKCYAFLKDIDMEDEDIKRIFQFHTVMLGSCPLKAATYICDSLGCGIYQTREIVKEDPQVMMKWMLGSKIARVPNEKKKPPPPSTSKTDVAAFLIELGFIKDSIEMKKVLKCCGCKVWELDERVEIFLKAGWDRKNVVDMMKRCPALLRQKKGVIEGKIDVLVRDFGIPQQMIALWPWCLGYAIPKLKLRFTMYEWLKSQGAFRWDLKLCTLLACSDKAFLENFVNRVHRGPDTWEEFKRQIYR